MREQKDTPSFDSEENEHAKGKNNFLTTLKVAEINYVILIDSSFNLIREKKTMCRRDNNRLDLNHIVQTGHS